MLIRTVRPTYSESRQKKESTERSQFLCFELLRSGLIKDREYSVICYIYSFSERCIPKSMKIMARALHMSTRWLTKIINRLVSRGLVRRRYMIYKRVCLTLVSLKEQLNIVRNGPYKGMLKALEEHLAFKQMQRSRREARELRERKAQAQRDAENKYQEQLLQRQEKIAKIKQDAKILDDQLKQKQAINDKPVELPKQLPMLDSIKNDPFFRTDEQRSRDVQANKMRYLKDYDDYIKNGCRLKPIR
jgi:DNA-binding MarR family transcriptional regulator